MNNKSFGEEYGKSYTMPDIDKVRAKSPTYEELLAKVNAISVKYATEHRELTTANQIEDAREFASAIHSSRSSIKVKKLKDNAKLPYRGSSQAAGYDLYACIDKAINIQPHTTEMIGTGLAMEIPDGYFGAIFARSGLAAKCGLRLANCVGVIDSDYRNEFIVALYNDSEFIQAINSGDRIAQLLVLPYQFCEFVEAEELSDTERGLGGFGSTGER